MTTIALPVLGTGELKMSKLPPNLDIVKIHMPFESGEKLDFYFLSIYFTIIFYMGEVWGWGMGMGYFYFLSIYFTIIFYMGEVWGWGMGMGYGGGGQGDGHHTGTAF